MSDKEYAYLQTLGYTGTIADMRKAYYTDLITNGGNPDIPITGEYIPGRDYWTSSSVSVTSQRINLTYFTAKVTETVTTVTAWTGSTAAGATPTVCQYGIYSVNMTTKALTLVATTANDTALFAGTNTDYPKAFSASFTKTAGQRYAIGILVVSGATLPNFVGVNQVSNAVMATRMADWPRLSGYLGGQSSFPSSIADASLTNATTKFGFYLNG